MQGKVFALTGGASGIGLGAAQILYARGASIGIGDIDQEALDNAAKLFQNDDERVLLTKLDVSKRSSVDSWISSIVSKFGKLDGAVNSAGVIGKHHGTRKLEEIDDDQWDLIIGVNLTGMMYCMRAELAAIKGPGSVVCVSSVQGTIGFAKHAAYAASKHGILGLVKSAAKEVGERKVRVNAVNPYVVKANSVEIDANLCFLQGIDRDATDAQAQCFGGCRSVLPRNTYKPSGHFGGVRQFDRMAVERRVNICIRCYLCDRWWMGMLASVQLCRLINEGRIRCITTFDSSLYISYSSTPAAAPA